MSVNYKLVTHKCLVCHEYFTPEKGTDRVCKKDDCVQMFEDNSTHFKSQYIHKLCGYCNEELKTLSFRQLYHKGKCSQKAHDLQRYGDGEKIFTYTCPDCEEEYTTKIRYKARCDKCAEELRYGGYKGVTDDAYIRVLGMNFPELTYEFMSKVLQEVWVFSEEEVLEFIQTGRKIKLQEEVA